MRNHPIVFLHGTNAGPWTMDNLKGYFQDHGFKCFSPTYRYHDLPDSNDRSQSLIDVSIADYVSDIAAFIKMFDEKPIIVGHSLGGLIAQLLASEGLIKAGVLLNSSIIHGTLPTTKMERALGKGFMSAGKFWEEAPGQDLELLATYGLNTMPVKQQHEICDRLSTESGRVLFEIFFWMYDINQTTKIDFDVVNTPLLFLCGTEDKVVPPTTAKTMVERYHELATFIEMRNRCHYMQLETGWKDIAQQGIDWIDTL